MSFIFRPLGWQDAQSVAAWRYDGPYAIYNFGRIPLLMVVLLRPLLDPFGAGYYAVDSAHDRLVGVFSFHKRAATVTIGLALRPDLTGHGLGLALVEAGLAFAKRTFAPGTFRLTVAAFNERAIRVYERAGFAPGKRFVDRTRSGPAEFIEMTRAA